MQESLGEIQSYTPNTILLPMFSRTHKILLPMFQPSVGPSIIIIIVALEQWIDFGASDDLLLPLPTSLCRPPPPLLSLPPPVQYSFAFFALNFWLFGTFGNFWERPRYYHSIPQNTISTLFPALQDLKTPSAAAKHMPTPMSQQSTSWTSNFNRTIISQPQQHDRGPKWTLSGSHRQSGQEEAEPVKLGSPSSSQLNPHRIAFLEFAPPHRRPRQAWSLDAERQICTTVVIPLLRRRRLILLLS